MTKNSKKLLEETEKLNKKNAALQQQLREAKESIDAIKTGNIDALVITHEKALKVYTEKTADKPYRILIEKMHEGAVTLNEDGTILYCNSYFANMVNLPLQKVIGTKFKNFIDDSSKEHFEALLKQGSENALKEEVYIHASDGKEIPVLMTVNTFSLDNIFVLSIILTDLTIQKKNQEELELKTRQLENNLLQLKESEEKIRVILDSSHIGAWELNLVKDTAWRSLTHAQIFGYDHLLPEWESEILMTHVIPEDREYAKQRFEEAYSKGKFSMECRINRVNDNSIRWISAQGVAYRNENGELTKMMGIVIDINERKQAEAEIKQKSEDLAHANKELVFQSEEKEKRAAELSIANKELLAFAYISSHDLQEPLRKIQTFADHILEKENQNLSDSGKDYFQRMQDAAGRMRQLIQDLFAYALTNATERKFEKTDLNIIIEEVKTDLKDTIQEKHATIEATEICEVNIIPFQFRQLMQNLISNALKFANPEHPPHIIIKSRIVKGSKLNKEKLLSEKNYCHIGVIDNGIGFDPQYKDRIFEVFQKLHRKEEYEGTGIGLAIVKKIVENHNGIITATSELNKGARFDIYIPITEK